MSSTAPEGTVAAPGISDAARLAALSRAGNAPERSPQKAAGISPAAIKDARKSFNTELQAIPDYLHHRAEQILDAMQLLHDICSKAVERVRSSSANVLKINVVVFERKTHGIKHCYQALCKLGFRERVVDFKKFAVYEGTFKQDAAAELSFLEHSLQAIDTCRTGAQNHCKGVDHGAKAAEVERIRQRTLNAIEEDRSNVQRRTTAQRLAAQKEETAAGDAPEQGGDEVAEGAPEEVLESGRQEGDEGDGSLRRRLRPAGTSPPA